MSLCPCPWCSLLSCRCVLLVPVVPIVSRCSRCSRCSRWSCGPVAGADTILSLSPCAVNTPHPLYAPVNVQPLQTALMLQKTTTTIEDKRANETLTDAELRTRESLSLITEEFDKAKNIHEGLLTTLHTLYVTLNGKNEAFPAAFATIGEFLSEQRQMALTEEIKEKTNEKNLRVECKWSTSPSQVVGCLI